MAKSKTSKLKRKPARAIRLTHRDKDIILALHCYRFLTTQHLQKLTGTESRWGMNSRLRLLYDHKYVDRPHAQKALYSHSDKRPVIYALGNKGLEFVKGRYSLFKTSKQYQTEKNRRVRERYIEHTLGISDFMVSIEMMCRNSERYELIEPQMILNRSLVQTQRSRYPFRWKTRIKHSGESYEIAIAPDYVFGIKDREKNTERFYFVEIDRGTMPVTRRDMSQTSFQRKILSYADTYERGLVKRRFGMNGFQVLTVTTSEAKIKAIQDAIANLTNKPFSANTFLFSTKGGDQAHFPFYSNWQNSKGNPSDII